MTSSSTPAPKFSKSGKLIVPKTGRVAEEEDQTSFKQTAFHGSPRRTGKRGDR